MNQQKEIRTWRKKMFEVIFESDTFLGKLFDILLLVAILLSVVVVMLESVSYLAEKYKTWLRTVEWIFTILFSIEYLARIMSVPRPKVYAISFLGIIDLLSILPTFISIFIVGAQNLLVLRIIRIIRVFRILKLTRFIGGARVLTSALKQSSHKVTVFLVAVLSLVTILGTLMYMIESRESGFTSIPMSIYWAIVTLTTVGYGDIVPQTDFGKSIATLIMIIGYGIIAIPTGIFTAELANMKAKEESNNACINCGYEGHDIDAKFCKKCGFKL